MFAAAQTPQNPIDLRKGAGQVLRGDQSLSADTAKGGRPAPVLKDFPDTEIGRLVAVHMNLLAGHGTDAEQRYQESLKNLRTRAPEATRVLVDAYARVGDDRYFRRWALLETLRELRDKSALPLAARVARSPLPPERFASDPERRSTDEELRIRVEAVEVLAALSAEEVPGADSELLRLTRHAFIGIRRAAIRGYLAGGRAEQRKARAEMLRKVVPKRDYGLITVNTTDIKQVPHPEIPEKLVIKKSRPPQGPAPRAKE
jgi:hypothetical protein